MRARLTGSLLVALLFGASSASAQEIHGRLLLPDGKPAAGARLERSWKFPDPATKDGEVKRWGDDRLKDVSCDATGAFRAAAPDVSVVYARDASGKFGALVSVTEAQQPDGLELTLAPLIEVRGRYDVRAAGKTPKQTGFWIMARAQPAAFDCVALCLSESREFRVWLPPGEYTTWSSDDTVNLFQMAQLGTEVLTITAGAAPVDLGIFVLDIPATIQPHGRVLDAEGKPVAGASVGQNVRAANYGGIWGQSTDGATTDAEGRFRFEVELYGEPEPMLLLAFDGTRTRGAVGLWDARAADAPLELTLVPTVHVHGSFAFAETQVVPKWTNVYVTMARTENKDGVPVTRDERILSCPSERAEFDFRLPPGTYWFDGYGTDSLGVKKELRLTADEPELDLGVVELPQTIIARHIGQPAFPWTLSDARGLAKETKLADLKGKWVVLEFWGYW